MAENHRELTEAEIETMDNCKDAAMLVGVLCDKVRALDGVDQRWISIAKTDLQKGFMSLIRAIARPATF